MSSQILSFANLLLASLLVGAMFGVWLFLNPKGSDSILYVALQKQAIRRLDKTMPALGAATILLTIIAAVAGRNDRTRFGLLSTAIVFLVVAGLVTRLANQPINAIVMSWNAEAPPGSWIELRDKWWRWHCTRLASGLLGLSMLIVATLECSRAG